MKDGVGTVLADRKILVTGASGMLGRALRHLLSSRNELTGVSKSGRDGIQACDLSKSEEITQVFEAKKPDLVINAAAYSDVDGCERDPGKAHEANALAVKYLSGLCGRSGIAFIHISTDYVFDGQKNSPYAENDTTNPINIYGLTKLEGEYYAARCESPSAIVRTSWLFGAGNPVNFVNAIAERMKKESVISVLDDQTDAPTSVADLSEAISRIAQRLLSPSRGRDEKESAELYHVCNSGFSTRYGMALKMKEIMGLKQVQVLRAERKSVRGPLAALRPPYAVMSNRHFEQVFGIKLRSSEESLKEYLLN